MTTDTHKPRRRFARQTLLRHALGMVRNPDIQIVRDLIYLAFGQVGAKAMGFLLFAYLARVLAPRDYGALETMLAIMGFAALVVDFGLGPTAVRYRAQNGPDRDAVVSIVPALRLGLALLCVPGAWLAVFFATDDPTIRMLGGLLALALLLQAWRQEWLLQSLGMMQLTPGGSSCGWPSLRSLRCC